MKHFLDLVNNEDVVSFLKSIGEKPYRARQIYRWIYKTPFFAKTFDDITDIPLFLRQKLSEKFFISTLKPLPAIKSSDGTIRYNFQTNINPSRAKEIIFPTVLIPSNKRKRNTICLSVQSGCPVGCSFCASGGNFISNLTKGEIIESYLLARQMTISEEKAAISDSDTDGKFGVLFMGSGEPFLNYANTLGAIYDLVSDDKIGLGARYVVLSTVGISHGAISRFSKDTSQLSKKIRLAISLHTADDKLRRELIPFKTLLPVSAILDEAFDYASSSGTRLTLECVMIKGLTDTSERLNLLSTTIKKYVKKYNWKDIIVNLIPFNRNLRGAKKGFIPPDEKSILSAKNFLVSRGIFTIIRANRGQDISSACGQLDAEVFFKQDD